jgi:hypothetical protein
LGGHIHRSKKENIAVIKVVAIILLTVVCFLFGLVSSISNGSNAIAAFNQTGGIAGARLSGKTVQSILSCAAGRVWRR